MTHAAFKREPTPPSFTAAGAFYAEGRNRLEMNSFALRDCGGSIGIVCSKMLLHGKMRFPHRSVSVSIPSIVLYDRVACDGFLRCRSI